MRVVQFLRLLSAALIAVFIWLGCAKDDFTPLAKLRILQTHQIIDSLARQALSTQDPIASFETLLPEIREMESVEQAEISEDKLCIKYKEGGVEFWSHEARWIDPPYARVTGNMPALITPVQTSSPLLPRNDCTVGNKKACLINAVYDDPDFAAIKVKIEQLSVILSAAGFDVTVVNGTNAHINFYGSAWDDYAVIYNFGHGSIFRNMTWLVTGQVETNSFNEILNEHYDNWLNEKIAVFHGDEANQVSQNSFHYGVSSRFFDVHYANGSFPRSLIDLTSCSALKLDDLKAVLRQKGARAIVGWTNKVGGGTGIASGISLFYQMISGKDLKDAFEVLPNDMRTYNDAKLVYYPFPDGGCTRLVEDTSALNVLITTPFDGAVITSRTVNVAGFINNASQLTNSMIEVNGVTSKLEVDQNFYFNQNIVLQSGLNNVRVLVSGLNLTGDPATGEAAVKVQANFPPLALWSRLVWNTAETDVDFHLLPPGATMDELFSYNDCYFGQTYTSWGGYLDVDDRYGYGPEHITLPANPAPGRYTMVVHYWDDHAGLPPDAFISVATMTESWTFNPLHLAQNYIQNGAGDAYAVCQIEFPSGKIYPLEQRIVTPRNENMRRLKKPPLADHLPGKK